jgi:hypothetical protein
MANGKKGYNYLIKGTVYPFDVLISVDEEDVKVIETLLILGVPKDDFNEDLKRKKLVHELFHHVAFLFERIGIQLDVEKSDEAYAYYLEWVTGQALVNLK